MDFQLVNSVINAIALFSFFSLGMAIFARIAHRYLLYRESKQPVPRLLKRDALLFAGLMAYIFLVIIFRLANVEGLRDNTLWLLLSNFLIQTPLAYWAYVEWTQ